jgi:hypothetical protein
MLRAGVEPLEGITEEPRDDAAVEATFVSGVVCLNNSSLLTSKMQYFDSQSIVSDHSDRPSDTPAQCDASAA